MKNSVLIVGLVLLLAGYVHAGTVTLIDPSLEAAITNYAYPTAVNEAGTVGVGWFSEWEAAKAKAKVVVDGSANFWQIANNEGVRAGFVTQVNETVGASFFQTVYLEAGNTYTLTAAATTGVRYDGATTVSKNDAKFAVAFAPYPLPGIPTPVLAETTGVIPNMAGVFVDYSVDYTPASSGYYNIALQNRGYVPNTGAGNNQSSVFFDNVRLTYVPEPTAAVLLLAGLAGAFVRRNGARA